MCRAVNSTVHTTLRAMPTQLVFGRDALLNNDVSPPTVPTLAAARQLRRRHHLVHVATDLANQTLEQPMEPPPGRLHSVPPPSHPSRLAPTPTRLKQLQAAFGPHSHNQMKQILTETQSKCNFETPKVGLMYPCLLYTSPSPRDLSTSRMPSSA